MAPIEAILQCRNFAKLVTAYMIFIRPSASGRVNGIRKHHLALPQNKVRQASASLPKLLERIQECDQVQELRWSNRSCQTFRHAALLQLLLVFDIVNL